ncbi:ATP-binding protein [Streptomyces sp. WAC 00631]|uniref:ATP-binding protein n=1 Tax=Streptomyces sp. WAC 00631 TaxID=2203201 RepID=UPI000F76C79E|nr:ATP-binding protein [Streptomyces sp. WAC 00631]MCC5036850.1 ATP-binding protein [Streptomyces sp. WAC 00631]
MISKPRGHCTVELQALPSRIGQVRRIVSAHLRYWRLDPLIDAAALGVTELLSNVHRHAQPDKNCTVEILLLPERLTVSVQDSDPRVPRVHAAGASATYGRGLSMIASVSESWGVRERDGGRGKAVWFSLHAPVSAGPGAPPPAAGPARAAQRPAGAGPAAAPLSGAGAGAPLRHTPVAPREPAAAGARAPG